MAKPIVNERAVTFLANFRAKHLEVSQKGVPLQRHSEKAMTSR